MPATGFTITVRKRDVVDLNISLDQAFQFIVSCGVVSDRGRAVVNEPGVNAPWSPPTVMPPVNPGSSTPSPH
jgi:uncharacterized membrane protein